MQVQWKTQEPGVTEHLISVMLLRENPRRIRVRPGRGDGGIDVYEPTDAGWIVHQIKYFANSLTDAQKSQISKSFKAVCKNAAKRGAVIAEWHLVMPLDPTPGNETWFENLTTDAGFSCSWVGLTGVEGLTSRYPDVVDYLVGNGQQRVDEMVKTVITALGLRGRLAEAAETGPIQPAQTREDLQNLFRLLDQSDPYFTYAFAVEPLTSPPLDVTQSVPDPGLVAVVQHSDPECRVTYRIYARYPQATDDRPVTIDARVETTPDSDAARAMDEFHTYGAPTVISAREGTAIIVNADLPGGLGGLLTAGTLTLGPVADNGAQRVIRLQILAPSGAELACVRLVMNPASVGANRQGVQATGREEQGVFHLEIRANLATQRGEYRVTLNDLTGLHPSDVLPAMRLLNAFTEPNTMRFAEPYGPITHDAAPVPGTLLKVAPLLAMIEALETLQNHTSQQIVIPDVNELNGDDARAILEAARLLADGTVHFRWTRFTPGMLPDVVFSEEAPKSWLFDQPFVVTVGEQQVVLGIRRTMLESARLEVIEEHDDPSHPPRASGRLVPADNDRAVTLYVPADPASVEQYFARPPAGDDAMPE